MTHWAHGGETKLSNLVTLCRFHHRQVHEGRVVVEGLDDGAFRFTRPDGKTFESPMPLVATWDELVADQRTQITPRTAISGWTGEELDVELAVDWLLRNPERQKNHNRIPCPD